MLAPIVVSRSEVIELGFDIPPLARELELGIIGIVLASQLNPPVRIMHRPIDHVARLVRYHPGRVDLIGRVVQEPGADVIIFFNA